MSCRIGKHNLPTRSMETEGQARDWLSLLAGSRPTDARIDRIAESRLPARTAPTPQVHDQKGRQEIECQADLDHPARPATRHRGLSVVMSCRPTCEATCRCERS